MALIALDFDGVLCHCQSFIGSNFDFSNLTEADYQRLASISDPPVPGAIQALQEYLRDDRIEVAIFSCRNIQPGGIGAMRRWLVANGVPDTDRIIFPTTKPQATVFVDDRSWPPQNAAMFPTIDEILSFEPWWKTS